MGALAPAERREHERHLAECPRCSASVAELAGLPGVLARIPAAEADALAQPPTGGPSPAVLAGLQEQ
ncbi:hypothetical protein ACC691_41125, partial [Rhizobium johnstonii]|uniref:hypothetical protein n=1 Tax=Rhizobium johnstonii TaxID=3019933 RepID=UPI003F96435F